MKRGSSAIADVHVSGDYDDQFLAYGRVLSKHQEANDDTDAFKLGAYFHAWLEMWLLSKGDAESTLMRQQKANAAKYAKIYWDEWHKLASTVGVTEEQIAAAMNSKGDPGPIIRWVNEYTRANTGERQAPESPTLAESVTTPGTTSTPLPSSVTLIQSASVQVPYGTVTIPRGTKLHLLKREGANLKVDYLGKEQTIPAASTELK